MTIEYKENEILIQESMNCGPLIGYINPYGKIVDFSTLVIEYNGHDSIVNPVTPIFLKYISYIVRQDINDINKQYIKRGYESYAFYDNNSLDEFIKELQSELLITKDDINLFLRIGTKLSSFYGTDILKYDLLKFFDKLYSNENFFDSLGRNVYVDNMDNVWEKYKKNFTFTKYQELGEKYKFYFENYLVIQLMSYFKDICVQYLGYDSIERTWPIGDLNISNNLYSTSMGYTFLKNPRIITTSENNINERFYNWLLMDWTIHKVPKKIWDEKNKKFVDEDSIFDYVYNEKEEILGKEIKSIKRLVKKEDRYKYFR